MTTAIRHPIRNPSRAMARLVPVAKPHLLTKGPALTSPFRKPYNAKPAVVSAITVVFVIGIPYVSGSALYHWLRMTDTR
jgi:hypothetical protein